MKKRRKRMSKGATVQRAYAVLWFLLGVMPHSHILGINQIAEISLIPRTPSCAGTLGLNWTCDLCDSSWLLRIGCVRLV